MVALDAAPSDAPAAEAGFNATWYSVGFGSDLGTEEVFATRLWGEPVVLYRDAAGEPVCVRDVCPHRSAPLSMGELDDGVLRCFYHGWGFGKDGACVSVPTASGKLDSICATSYAVAEHDDMLWVWRGHPLSADARKLPVSAADAADAALPTFVVDTTLDYGSEWSTLVARSLASPHLSLGTEGVLPAPAAAGSAQSAAAELDEHTPVVVRHRGVSGGGALLGEFAETAHVVPIAPQRARVLLRQRFELTPLLAFLLQLPGAAAFFALIVRNWNYQLALDETQQLQTKTPSAGAGADRVARFRAWHERALSREGAPYFARWGRALADQFGQQQTDEAFGTYGLKKNYVLDTPVAQYAPLQTSEYAGLLDRYKATQQSIVAALLTAPAGLLTYKTVAPAVAVVLGGHVS